MGTYRCDYCNRKETASGNGYSLPWGWATMDGRHFCSSACVREFKAQQLREREAHDRRMQEERMSLCEYCSKKYLEDGCYSILSNGRQYRRYDFCSRACFVSMKEHFRLEECDESGRVLKKKLFEIEEEDPYEDVEEIDPTKYKWDDEDENQKVPKPEKKEKKTVVKSSPQKSEPTKKSKKDIKQERKQRVQQFNEFMNNAKKNKK